MKPSRVHILGASGSGTTTLGRALAQAWAVPHADADDYFWMPTDPPYLNKRPVDERIALMQSMFVPRGAWVLSGSMTGWGDPVIAACDAVVFLTLDPQERLRRLEEREQVRTSARSADGAGWEEFRAWAAGYDDPEFEGRSRTAHENWLATVGKPVLHLDSSDPTDVLRDAILQWEP